MEEIYIQTMRELRDKLNEMPDESMDAPFDMRIDNGVMGQGAWIGLSRDGKAYVRDTD